MLQLYILLPLYLAAGLLWTPLLLAHDSILGELACEGNFQTLPPHNPHGAVSGLQSERRTLLRRLTRASRIARDIGLLFAALMLPLIPSRSVVSSPTILSDFNDTNCLFSPPCGSELYGLNNASILVESVFVWEEPKQKQNATDKTWMPPETEEELEGWREEACGSRGCPGNDIPDGKYEFILSYLIFLFFKLLTLIFFFALTFMKVVLPILSGVYCVMVCSCKMILFVFLWRPSLYIDLSILRSVFFLHKSSTDLISLWKTLNISHSVNDKGVEQII